MNTKTAIEKDKGQWVGNCVKWNQFATTLVAITLALAGVFTWMFDIHASRPHKDAATIQQMEVIRSELREARETTTKTREAIAGMNAKLDNVQKGIEEVKKLVR